MNPVGHHVGDEAEDFPYKVVADEINNFVYPPIRSVGNPPSISMERRLPLDHPMPEARAFAVYVSIPYCRVKCHSCHCFKGLVPRSVDRDDVLDDYVDALILQTRAYAEKRRFRSATCGAVYIGGGTGSVLTQEQVRRLIAEIQTAVTLTEDAEFNFEGNPEDFTPEYLQNLKQAGVSRVSIGYQSSQQEILDALNSPHNAEESVESVKNALSVGFDTVNVDLLYNVPGQTEEKWRRDLRTLIDLGPQGICAGDYVVFPGSNAELLISRGRLQDQHDLKTAFHWYLVARNTLEEHKYREQVRGIYAFPGHYQRYVDLCCPKGCDIVGIGAGALGFIDRYQFRSPFDSGLYANLVHAGKLFEADSVSRRATDQDLMQRFIMHNFFASSLDRDAFAARFDCDPVDAFPNVFSKLDRHRLVSVDEKEIKLTELGWKWRRNVYHEFRTPDDGRVLAQA